jgi:hypothetical protein
MYCRDLAKLAAYIIIYYLSTDFFSQTPMVVFISNFIFLAHEIITILLSTNEGEICLVPDEEAGCCPRSERMGSAQGRRV